MKKYMIMISILLTCSIFLIACGGSSSKDNGEGNGNGSLPETIEIDEELRENGVDLILESISFEDNYIAVDFNAVNTTGHAVQLAEKGIPDDGEPGGLILEDDTGHTYKYVADRNDHRVKIMDLERMDGTIHFEGKLQEDAESLKLMFNPDEDQSNERTPIFTFENIKINP